MRTPFYPTENRIQSQFKPPPDLLTPYAVQLALTPLQIYSFSRALGADTSKYLYGAGSAAENREYPLPFDGHLVRLRVWSTYGAIYAPADADQAFTAGYRLSCYAQYDGSRYFIIKARINGVTYIQTGAELAPSYTVFATIGVRFKRYAGA